MRNSLYTVGILLATCVLVIFALVLSIAEIREYTHGVQRPEVSLPASTGGAREAEQPQPGGPEGAIPRLLSLAPSDAFAAAVIDVERLVASGALEATPQLKNMAEARSDVMDPQAAKQVAFFVAPGAGGATDKPFTTGALLYEAATEDVRQALQDSAESTATVEGMDAYKVEDYYGSLVGDDMILMGDTTDALATIIQRNEAGGGGMSGDLRGALEGYSDSAFRFAAILPAEVKQQMLQQAQPQGMEFLQDLSKVAGGIDLQQQNLSLDGRATFGSAGSAQTAADKANQQMDGVKGQVEQMIQQMGEGGGEQQRQAIEAVQAMLNSVEISADGADFVLSVNVNTEQIGQAMGFFMMQMMGGMTGGGPGGPAGR